MVSLGFDRDDDVLSLPERLGYREGQTAEVAGAKLKAIIEQGSAARDAREAALLMSVPEPAMPDAAEVDGISEAAIVEMRHAAEVAAEETAREHEAIDSAELPDGAFGSVTVASGGGGGAVAPTSNTGDQAHVGGTGVVSTASPDNFDVDTAEDDEIARAAAEQAEQEAKRQAAEQARVQAAQEAAAAAQAERDSARIEEANTAQSEPQPEPENEAPAPVAQRIRVGRGEPIVDAVYAKRGFKFDGSGTVQVKSFPASLEKRLREDLASMTNEQFASDLPISQLLAAFVASEVGALARADELEGLDENTRTALQAFRMIDHRTGTVEQRLSTLEDTSEQTLKQVEVTMRTLQRYAEQARLLENAVVFLVTERIDPSSFATVAPAQAQLLDGKYRQTRDRLRQLTDAQLRGEHRAEGRPIR
ncbi:MAG TPA: hypothetical protein VFU07_05180 [Candidatus Lumbricidophila sp.]|nr:hypothetical protein [Candidatus Lumbricidophila sp.]